MKSHVGCFLYFLCAAAAASVRARLLSFDVDRSDGRYTVLVDGAEWLRGTSIRYLQSSALK